MPSPDAHTARALTHAQLGRVDQVIGMIWSAYPLEADFDTCLDLLEAEGLSNQNRPRLRRSLRASRLVSQGKTTGSYRINPRYTEFLTAKYAPIVGAPKQISVHDEQAVIPAGTIPLDRKYIKEIVRQVNEGYVAGHYDSAAVMIRRLTESLLIEVYVRAGRENVIRAGTNFMMFDGILSAFAADPTITRSRNLVASLRKVKDVGDTAAHSRTYITKKVDVDDIKSDARRSISELGSLAGL